MISIGLGEFGSTREVHLDVHRPAGWAHARLCCHTWAADANEVEDVPILAEVVAVQCLGALPLARVCSKATIG